MKGVGQRTLLTTSRKTEVLTLRRVIPTRGVRGIVISIRKRLEPQLARLNMFLVGMRKL